MPFQSCQGLALVVRLPQPDCSILTAAGDQSPIAAQRNAPDGASMSLQNCQQLATCRLPQANGSVLTAAGHDLAISAQRNGPDPTCMPPQSRKQLAAGRLPQVD